ncbi:MAG TPA: hypothetical protein ENL20_02730 [Candidatus Cloacimonetes bacterium]|nr:hypothetical protein [Candidatus Cloacimonadota bacterium]
MLITLRMDAGNRISSLELLFSLPQRREGTKKKRVIMKKEHFAITTIMGMLPMAPSKSEGSELKSPMALTVIGGLISAAFFTLFVIPVIYSLVDRKKKEKVES